MRILLSALLALLAGAPAAAVLPPGIWIDLSHRHDAETINWHSEHGGTHMDAPSRLAKGRQTADEVPLERLTGEAVVIDVSAKCEANADYEIQTTDFMEWESRNGPIAPKSIVLLKTGFGKAWPDRKSYLGTEELGPEAAAKLHFPGLHPEAAKWLIDRRKIKSVGIDTSSIDYGQSTLFKTHALLFDKNVPAFENLAALDELPTRVPLVVALPTKIKGGTGAPLRIAAFIPEKP